MFSTQSCLPEGTCHDCRRHTAAANIPNNPTCISKHLPFTNTYLPFAAAPSPTFQPLQHHVVSPLAQQPQPAAAAAAAAAAAIMMLTVGVVLPHHHAHALPVAAELQHSQQLQPVQLPVHLDLDACSRPAPHGVGATINDLTKMLSTHDILLLEKKKLQYV